MATRDEIEILEFYRTGSSLEDLSYSFDYSKYQLKRFLAMTETEFIELGYQAKSLNDWFNP